MKLKSKVIAEKDVERIVVLNSGGFDSVVLSHEEDFLNPESEIYDLFFSYGQNSEEEERRCSSQCAEKLHHKFKEITLPKFDWCDNEIIGGKNKNQYIHQRNLVFLSYAISFAESIGAKKIFCAFICSGTQNYYPDTSPEFLEKMNIISTTLGITIEAPFINEYKDVLLASLARNYKISESEFHSCNLGNSSCGKCLDCRTISHIYNDIIYPHMADDIFIDNNFRVNNEFIEALQNTKVTSLKLYINDSCQFRCDHCFLGSHSHTTRDTLTVEEWINIIDQAKEIGIKHIDFFGKEPLFDDSIFSLLGECNDKAISTSIVTNGVNIPLYLDKLERYLPEVVVSVESFGKTTHRTSSNGLKKNIENLLDREIPVSVTFDLSKETVASIFKTFDVLYKMGVRNFYVKPLRPFGEYEDKLMKDLIAESDIFDTIKGLATYLEKHGDANITVSLSQMDLQRMYEKDKDRFNNIIGYSIINKVPDYYGVQLELELFCNRFKNMCCVTPDGYVLGCASEYCCDDLMNRFNLRKMSLKECIDRGKKSLDKYSPDRVGCYFTKEYYKNGHIFS